MQEPACQPSLEQRRVLQGKQPLDGVDLSCNGGVRHQEAHDYASNISRLCAHILRAFPTSSPFFFQSHRPSFHVPGLIPESLFSCFASCHSLLTLTPSHSLNHPVWSWKQLPFASLIMKLLFLGLIASLTAPASSVFVVQCYSRLFDQRADPVVR
jgi:hypothetical protein